MDFVLWKTKNTQKKKNTIMLCSMNFLFWKAGRDEWTNDSLSAKKMFLNEFLITVRKKEHNEEYEPNSLRTFFASF